jgi:hypothetical protein
MVRWSPFLAAATLSGDTPRPTISIAPIPGTDDLFLIDTQYPGRRFVNFARRINARLPGFVTFLGVNTGMRTTIEREFDYLNVAITIEDDHVVFDPRELAREYGRDIPELSTPAPERSPLRIIPITPEEHQLEFALRRLQTPEWQIAYALQQLRNRESDNDADHVAYLRRRGANQWEIERVIRELRNARRARPYQPPTSGELLESFPGLADAPPSTRVFPREDWVDAVPLEVAADEARARTAADNILSEIRAIDPSYSPPTLNAANFPTTMEGRIGYISMLRAERAAASFRVRGEVQPLQIETMRFLQTRADVAYEEALALEAAGQLEPDLSPQEARGRHVDETLRREAADFFTSLGLSTDDESIRINRREYITRRTFRRPDVRVADLAIDVSLSDKSPGRRQIRGYFDALFRPRHVAIIRPSQVGRTYLITPPPSRYSR